MPYDETVAKRVRNVLKRRKGVTERKMFGGIAFLVNGHMCCGVNEKNIVLRLGKEGAAEAIRERHTREMDFTGTPMASMIYLTPTGYRSEEDLKAWVDRAVQFAKTLPPKT
jgi:TfoX/Sxy family transcriptional regulator of competence genes